MNKGQPTVSTSELREGDRVIVQDMVSRVIALSAQEDGSVDVAVEPEMDDNRVLNVGRTYLAEPLWIKVRGEHCGEDGHHLWHGHDFNATNGPAWCSGEASY